MSELNFSGALQESTHEVPHVSRVPGQRSVGSVVFSELRATEPLMEPLVPPVAAVYPKPETDQLPAVAGDDPYGWNDAAVGLF